MRSQTTGGRLQQTVMKSWPVQASSIVCRDWTTGLAITSSNESNAASPGISKVSNLILVPGCSPAYSMLLCKELALYPRASSMQFT